MTISFSRSVELTYIDWSIVTVVEYNFVDSPRHLGVCFCCGHFIHSDQYSQILHLRHGQSLQERKRKLTLIAVKTEMNIICNPNSYCSRHWAANKTLFSEIKTPPQITVFALPVSFLRAT
jgi:hypothetical protein